MEYSTIKIDKKEGYLIIWLNRPDKLNALNKQMFDDLDDIFKKIELDESVKGLILTGTGEKAFAAGADIKELNVCNKRSGKQFSEYGSYVMKRLSELRIPTIAAVNGFALGGGCELSLACQMRFASDKAKFGQPEVNLGIIPGYGATQRLTKLVGKAKATELILTGNIIDATTAEKIGLVNAVYSPDELLNKVEDLMKLILTKAPIAVASAIDCINNSEKLTELEGLSYESRIFGEVCGTDDFKEGTTAFLEKRQAQFSGH